MPRRGRPGRLSTPRARSGDGVARIRIGRHARLPVSVAKAGYDPYQQRLQFRGKPKVGVRVYQAKLQWPLLRRHARPDAGAPVHPRSAAVQGRLERGRRRADGVPGRGRRGHRLRRRTSAAASARTRCATAPESGGATLPAGTWPPRPRSSATSSSCTGWTATSTCSTATTAACSGATRPARRSSRRRSCSNGVDYFGAWNGTVYALDLRTRRARWTYNAGPKITSSASYAGGTIFIGDYGGRLLALSARNGGLRWSGSVNGRIYGTPAVASGPGLRDLLDGRLADRLLDAAAAGSGRSAPARTSTPRPRSGTDVSTSAPTTAASTPSRRAAGESRGATPPRARSPARPRSSTASSTSATASTASTGSTPAPAAQIFRFPDGAFVPVSGNGRRLLLHGFSRLYAVEHRRR